MTEKAPGTPATGHAGSPSARSARGSVVSQVTGLPGVDGAQANQALASEIVVPHGEGSKSGKKLNEAVSDRSRRASAFSTAEAAGGAGESSDGASDQEGALPPLSADPRADPTAKIKQYYALGESVGRGGFGEVVVALDKQTQRRVAVKMLSKIALASAKDRTAMRNEATIMAKLPPHENVVNLHETYEDRKAFYLVIDLCEGGEVMRRILDRNRAYKAYRNAVRAGEEVGEGPPPKAFSEEVASAYARGMARAIKHCHDNGVVHRDIKPENFLLTSAEHDATEVKLADFGLAAATESPDEVLTNACGSAYYIAPEVFRRRYTKAVDVWSLGVVLYLMLTGVVPFGAKATKETAVYQAIRRDPLLTEANPQWRALSGAAKELLSGLLEKDPTKRYTIEQVLSHPWVEGSACSSSPLDTKVMAGIKSFQGQNAFKKAAVHLIADSLSAADISSLRATFHAIDADGNGMITLSELHSAMSQSGEPNVQKVAEILRGMDADRDGQVSYEEFLTATAEQKLINHQNNIWWAFCSLDRNGDGKIDAEEAAAVLAEQGEENIARCIAEADKDGDGKLDYYEFLTLVLPQGRRYKISAAPSSSAQLSGANSPVSTRSGQAGRAASPAAGGGGGGGGGGGSRSAGPAAANDSTGSGGGAGPHLAREPAVEHASSSLPGAVDEG